jgi:8-oxo-dGTP pyrophosphatase MutT (NUDIX family)
MHREPLLALLHAYRAGDFFSLNEENTWQALMTFVQNQPECFERTLMQGHVTGSAFVLNFERDACLLTHHRKLGRWLQPGGHADGDADVLNVSAREALEETGIEGLEPISFGILDLDIHCIPTRAHEPEHLHYDVRFAFVAPEGAQFVVSDESHDLAWVKLEEVVGEGFDPSLRRMAQKFARLS